MKRLHYGWAIVALGVLVKMSGLGFGRFAYAMLLPAMRESLGFNYIRMGLLSGGIMLGYLIFSYVGGTFTRRYGPKKVLIVSLISSVLSMAILGQSASFSLLLLLTFIMGAGAAGAHISTTTLPMSWFPKETMGRALGTLTGGTGLGIVITGLMIPPLLISFGDDGWRVSWMIMSAITLLVLILSGIFIRERPDDRFPLPKGPPEHIAIATAPAGQRGRGMSLRILFLVYFVFGFAYNIYATYFVAFLVEDLHLPKGTAGVIWAIFGWMCMLSGLIWGFLADRFGSRSAIIWNNGIISLSVLLPLFFHAPSMLGLSTFLFGGAFLGMVTIVATVIGDQAEEKRAWLFGLITLVHGIGQLLGTTIGGYLKDYTGSFQLTFTASLLGFLLCLGMIFFSKKTNSR
ncbi:MAG: YbfB/YjiJ family MFS transporter [Smithellaceae bacterium]|nr:YbfB/YjiJ family MFS transporter [Smithellaceae bacterium]